MSTNMLLLQSSLFYKEMLERQGRSDAKVSRDGMADRGNNRRKNVVIVDEQPAQRQSGGGCCGGGGGS